MIWSESRIHSLLAPIGSPFFNFSPTKMVISWDFTTKYIWEYHGNIMRWSFFTKRHAFSMIHLYMTQKASEKTTGCYPRLIAFICGKPTMNIDYSDYVMKINHGFCIFVCVFTPA